MDLYTLDNDYPALTTPAFLQDKYISDYESLIWTERFLGTSEFILKTNKIYDTLLALPLNAPITHRETDQVMIVESYEIKDDDSGVSSLVVKGRGFETYLEHRVVGRMDNATGNPQPPFVAPSNDRYTIDQLSHTSCVSARGLIDLYIDYSATQANSLYNAQATYVENFPDTPVKRSIEWGDLHAKALEIANGGAAGIKVLYEPTSAYPLNFVVYDGEDLTSTVVFSRAAGHLKNLSYLWNNKGSHNVAYVYSKYAAQLVYLPGYLPSGPTAPNYTRRCIYVNAEDITDAAGSPDLANKIQARGLAALITANASTFAFDAEVGDDSPYVYKRDYDVGSRITAIADYGVKQTMVVSEYIRTEDLEGERGYPTLSQLIL